MELRGNFQIVILRAWPTAQGAKVKPHHATRLAPRHDFAGLNVQHRIFVVHLGELIKGVRHLGIGLRPQRGVVELDLFQRAASVIGTVVHVDDFHALVQQRNRRQDTVTVQAIRVQAVGLKIGGGDEAHAILKQRRQQTMQDHGIGDVGHVEFIEADQLVALGDSCTQHIQRVRRAL